MRSVIRVARLSGPSMPQRAERLWRSPPGMHGGVSLPSAPVAVKWQPDRWLQQSSRSPPHPDHEAESTAERFGQELVNRARHGALERVATNGALERVANNGASAGAPDATGGAPPDFASRASGDEVLAERARRDLAVPEAPTGTSDHNGGAGNGATDEPQRDEKGDGGLGKFVKGGALVGTALGIYKSLSYPWRGEYAVCGSLVAIGAGAVLGATAVPAFVLGDVPGVAAWTMCVWFWHNVFS